jgi:hypothetical protein
VCVRANLAIDGGTLVTLALSGWRSRGHGRNIKPMSRRPSITLYQATSGTGRDVPVTYADFAITFEIGYPLCARPGRR